MQLVSRECADDANAGEAGQDAQGQTGGRLEESQPGESAADCALAL